MDASHASKPTLMRTPMFTTQPGADLALLKAAENEASRKFDLNIDIAAPVELVWKTLTDAVELTRWLAIDAQIQPRAGGEIFLSWGVDMEVSGRITHWEPERAMAWTQSVAFEGAPPSDVTVRFELEPQGTGTRVRVIHAGIGRGPDWDVYFDSISYGWRFELRGLRHYIERHRGSDRRPVWARKFTRMDAADAAACVLGEQGRLLRGRLANLAERDRFELQSVLSGMVVDVPNLTGTVIRNGLPRSFLATIDSLNDSLFRFEYERARGGGGEVWLWLSTYGLDATVCQRMQRGLESGLESVLKRGVAE